jgi:predicted dienelactone hydrolase
MKSLLISSVAIMMLVGCQTKAQPSVQGDVQIATAQRFNVGQTTRRIIPQAPRHWRGSPNQALVTRVWFPVDTSNPATPNNFGPPGSPFFVGYPVARGAQLSEKSPTYPAIIMSHGLGGNGDNMDWLASPLAAAGYIVIAVDHPGTSATGPMTWDGLTLFWERTTDLSNVLDSILQDPEFGARIDPRRIGALGFSLGGNSVLGLAGARTDLAKFLAFCETEKNDPVCRPPEVDRIGEARIADDLRSDATKASIARGGNSYLDNRVKAVFAIAPALGQAASQESLKALTVPVRIVAGANDVNVPLRTNFEYLLAAIPKSSGALIPNAAHYSFLPVCTSEFATRRPALCQEASGTDRATFHRIAVGDARTFFDSNLR